MEFGYLGMGHVPTFRCPNSSFWTQTEATVGNPASDKRKLTEKRRKKYEQRLGPGAYLPKEERLKLNEHLEKMAAAAEAEKAKAKAEKAKPKK
jgi:hypothetical protein